MNANPILLQKKYVRIVELFAEKMGISVETALGIFYHSQLYQLISEGISDMHCMSDGYLAEELEIEYNKILFPIYYDRMCYLLKRNTRLFFHLFDCSGS